MQDDLLTQAALPAMKPYTHLRGWFVTGTDTDAGKTLVSAALLHLVGRLPHLVGGDVPSQGAAQPWRTAGYKPVAAGARVLADSAGLHNDDVYALHGASTASVTLAQVGPCVLQAACAPHIAAQLEGRALRAAPLLAGAAQLAQLADWLVVEGAGGFALPLCLPGTDADFPQGFDGTDLAAYLGLPVVLVVGLRTGCLNHALLTAQAIRSKGLHVAGWVANSLQADWPYHADNVDTLHHLLGSGHYGIAAPCWGVVPWLSVPSAAAAAQHLDAAAIQAAMARQLAVKSY